MVRGVLRLDTASQKEDATSLAVVVRARCGAATSASDRRITGADNKVPLAWAGRPHLTRT